MRSRKRLVQIQVNDVDTHIARPRDANQRVHVRAVHVDQTACFVDDPADLANIPFEKAKRVRIGQH